MCLYCKQETFRQPPGDVLKIALDSLLKSQSYLGYSEMSFWDWQQKPVARSPDSLLSPCRRSFAAAAFLWWLTKLTTLEMVSVYLHIRSSPSNGVSRVPYRPWKGVPSSPASVKHDHCCMGRRCCRCTIVLPPCCSDRGQPHANHANHTITFPSLCALWSLKSRCVGGCAFAFAGFLFSKCPLGHSCHRAGCCHVGFPTY